LDSGGGGGGPNLSGKKTASGCGIGEKEFKSAKGRQKLKKKNILGHQRPLVRPEGEKGHGDTEQGGARAPGVISTVEHSLRTYNVESLSHQG